ncbi:MAG: hypothetical protein ABL895_06015 [Cyclobacteriaceae bacterium]
MLKVLLTILFIYVQLLGHAQGDYRSGYIIKPNGDSLVGLVQYPTTKISKKYCFFKADKKGKSQRYNPDELSVYGYINERRYEARVISEGEPGKRVTAFLEVLVKGELSLYRGGDIFYYEKDTLLELPSVNRQLQNSGTGSSYRSERKYVGILNLLLNECNLRADDTKYEQRDLVNLVQNYNRCLGAEGMVYKQNVPWTKFNYQLIGGLTLSNMQMENFGNITFTTSTGYFFGASVDISAPRVNEKIQFSLEPNFYKTIYQGYKESFQATTLRSDLIMDISLLRIPIGLRYNLLSETRTPYVKVGFLTSVDLESSYKLITEEESSGMVVTSVTDKKLASKAQQGFWIGAGYSVAVVRNYRLFIEVRYEKTVGAFYDELQTPFECSNISMLIGLRF